MIAAPFVVVLLSFCWIDLARQASESKKVISLFDHCYSQIHINCKNKPANQTNVQNWNTKYFFFLYRHRFSCCLTVSIFLRWVHMGNMDTKDSSPSIMIYRPANSNWHWLALIGMGPQVTEHRGQSWGRTQSSPPPVTMVTAWCKNRCSWHFWLMCRHWWMTAVTQASHRWQPGKRDDIISVGPILGYDEDDAVCVFMCVRLQNNWSSSPDIWVVRWSWAGFYDPSWRNHQ